MVKNCRGLLQLIFVLYFLYVEIISVFVEEDNMVAFFLMDAMDLVYV